MMLFPSLLTGKAVSAAGYDQRYFDQDGERYHHIFDPRTGYPARSDLMSVTLVADSSLDSDAFDTAVFILGLEKGRELLRKYGNIEAVFVTTDRKIHVTDGLKNRFMFNDESNEYRYVQ
jgi:FAD:protein FMN transferase